MISTKKAIVLSFLVTVLFSIMLFGTAIGIGAKLLRLSGQASDNFDAFYNNLKEVAESKKTDLSSGFMLILDDDTFVAGMKKGSSTKVEFDKLLCIAEVTTCDRQIIDETFLKSYDYPNECQDKDCLILCNDLGLSEETLGNRELSCKSIRVKVLDFNLKQNFFFIRYAEDFIAVSNDLGKEYNKLENRRFPIRITKNTENQILVEKNG